MGPNTGPRGKIERSGGRQTQLEALRRHHARRNGGAESSLSPTHQPFDHMTHREAEGKQRDQFSLPKWNEPLEQTFKAAWINVSAHTRKAL